MPAISAARAPDHCPGARADEFERTAFLVLSPFALEQVTDY